ncbi:MAG TPA: hypothetical protein VKT81_10300 [Bryobacteraceae bacterium]|nr:hypothetical protein [Bryobacteraceae bacterium]
MRIVALCGGLLAAILASGCSHARVITTIKADGSWTRSVSLIGQEKKDAQMTPTLEDTFVLPSGAAWKSHEEKKNDERTLTFERTLAAGAALDGDLSIKGGADGKLNLVNHATVTRLAGNRFEYKETLHWKGDPAKILGKIKPEDLAKIKSKLPPELATDSNAQALADKTAELSVPLLFGPGDPLLAMGLLHPDLAVRRAGQRMGALMVKALEQQFGDKLTVAQRREIAARMIQETFSSATTSTNMKPDPMAGPPSKSSGGLVPLIFLVKAPGRVVSSNGEVDDLTGEVFWGLFSEAAGFKDVVLSAVVEVN